MLGKECFIVLYFNSFFVCQSRMLNTWICVSNMKFSASKCKVLTVTRKNSPLTHEYHLANTYIKRVLEEKDLGLNKAYHLKQFIVGLACYAYCTQD